MAFGDYATLLSNFTGPDETPLSEGGNWAKVNAASGSSLRRVGNQVSSTTTSGIGDSHAYWTPAKFGPDVETYMTVSTKANAVDLTLRVNSVGGYNAWTGYWLQIEASNWGIYYLLDGVSHVLASATKAYSDGDKVGFSIECFTLKAWHYTGGAWTNVVTATDSYERWPSYGSVALGCDQSVGRLDDFYAGTIPRTTPCGTPRGQIYRRIPASYSS